MDITEYRLIDIAIPVFSTLWIAREMFGFARTAPVPPLARPAAEGDDAEPEEPSLTPGVRRDLYDRRFDLYIPALIAALFYLLCIWRLAIPHEYVFDEVHHARTAMEYVDGLNPHEWSHPPFSKEMMALSMKAWHVAFDPRDGVWKPDAKFPGDEAIGWRYASVLFGTATLPALYFLAFALFGNRTIATTSTILLALDGVFFVQSRIAMTNIFTVFFITLAAGGLALFFRQPRARWLLLAGGALGFAIASRWSSLYAWAVAAMLVAVYAVSLQGRGRELGAEESEAAEPQQAAPISLVRLAGLAALCLVLLPTVIYFATYIPNMLQGPGTVAQKLLTANGPNGVGWLKTITMQRDMYVYHSTLDATHPYSSPWWSWPLELRPVWYYWDNKVVPGKILGIWCIGNVFLWWASVPAFLTAGYLSWRNGEVRRPGSIGPLALVAAFGLGQWLAWGVKARALDFMHYYFECIPFACLGLAYIGYRMWDPDAPVVSRSLYLRRVFVCVYAASIALWFFYFYPLLSAYPVTDWFYGKHLWLDRAWI